MSELNEANDPQQERYGRPVSGAVLPEDPDVEGEHKKVGAGPAEALKDSYRHLIVRDDRRD